MGILKRLRDSLINFKIEEVKELVRKAIEEGIDPVQILNEGLVKAMEIVGEKFEKQEYFLPELLVAARCMYAAIDILKPELEKKTKEGAVTKAAKVVLGTVKGDLHDIGKNIVKTILGDTNQKCSCHVCSQTMQVELQKSQNPVYRFLEILDISVVLYVCEKISK